MTIKLKQKSYASKLKINIYLLNIYLYDNIIMILILIIAYG